MTALLLGRSFDNRDVTELFRHFFEHYLTDFKMTHFASPEKHVDFCLVAIGQEATGVVGFELIVMDIGFGSDLNFLDLDLSGLLLRLMKLFLHFIFEFAIVHDPADGRFRLGSDFDEVQTLLVGNFLGFERLDDSQLLAIGSDKPNLG